MGLRLIHLLLISAILSHAAVYYVNAVDGDDGGDGSTPSTAWKTLSKVSASAFNPGDFVLLHRNQAWQERLMINASGESDKPVTFGAYSDGAAPVIDGTGVQVPALAGLVAVLRRVNVVIQNLEVKNSIRNGIHAYVTQGLVVRNCSVHDNRQNGILAFDSQNVSISDSALFNNSLDLSASFAGIQFDGTGGALSQFVITNSSIHDNIGGLGWNSGNGIYLGHTGGSTPTLNAVAISNNEIFRNGNPTQDQAGRGVSGTFQGDVTVTANNIHHNASAGLYLGDHGLQINITILNNTFTDNALRQFGGFTDARAIASHNTLIVDDPNITGMGAEVGGAGSWLLDGNVFYFYGGTQDTYRGFIRINDATQDAMLQSDYNLFYSGGPNRWKQSDGTAVSFRQWRAAGYDKHSINPQ